VTRIAQEQLDEVWKVVEELEVLTRRLQAAAEAAMETLDEEERVDGTG